MARLFLENVHRFLSSDPDAFHGGRIVRFLFLGGVLVLVVWLVYFAVVSAAIPYPLEYREGAAQVMTEIMLRGGNPFTLENQPLGMNNYGIAYGLSVLPFAALFGNTLLVHRAVTLIYLLLACVLVYRAAFAQNRDPYFSLACSVFVLIPLTGHGGIGAFPSAMGVFLFLAGTLVPFRRSFDYPGLFFSAVFCLIAFYSKPYFLLSFGIVASYTFLFVSRKKGLYYSAFFVLAFGLLFLLTRHTLKLYFVDVLIGNLANTTRSQQHLIAQLVEFIREYSLAAILALLAVLPGVVRAHARPGFFEGVRLRFQLAAPERPLISPAPDYFLYFFCCSTLAFVLLLGLHVGSSMVYIYQIMAPPFLLWLFRQLGGWRSRLAVIAAPVLLLNMTILAGMFLHPALLSQKDSPEWARLYGYVDCSWRVLNSPVIVPKLLACGRLPVDSGQTEYYYRFDPYPKMLVLGPEYRVVKSNGREYKETVIDSVRNAEFDRVILDSRQWLYGFTREDLALRYMLVETIDVSMPQTERLWTIEIWEPADN